jgi:sulfatase maturation enzyme AslB (radical SAM superfamily)
MIKYPPKPEPIRAEIEATNVCNAKCSFCPRWNITHSKGYIDLSELVGFLYKLEDYSESMWLNKHSEKIRFPRLVFGGIGEPTLHPRIVDIVSECSSHGFDTELITNGSKLSSSLAYKLADAGLTRLSISLHSLNPQIYNDLMGLRLNTILPRIAEALGALDNTDVDIEIWRVSPPDSSLWKELKKEEKQYRSFLSQYKKSIRILGPTVAWNRGGQLPETYWPTVHDNDKIWCELLYFTFNVAWDGSAVICCCDYPQISVPLGNAWKEPIEVIQKRRYEVFKNPQKQPICQKCRRPKDQTYEKVYPTLNVPLY